MPMNWSAENEAKLFALILRHADVKVSADVIRNVAAEMGPDCTPKAITHRIAKIKAAANLPASGASATDPASANGTPPASDAADAAAPKTPNKTPKKPAAKGTPGRGRKRTKEATPAEAVDDEEEDAGVGNESPSKKVKREDRGDEDEDAA